MMSFINIKYGDVATESSRNEQHAIIVFLWAKCKSEIHFEM